MANTEMLKQILDDPVSIQHFIKARDSVSAIMPVHLFENVM